MITQSYVQNKNTCQDVIKQKKDSNFKFCFQRELRTLGYKQFVEV